jgi:hypothetical protein
VDALSDLPKGWQAYVDADWLRPHRGPDVPAILADPDGALRWRSLTASPFGRTSNGDTDLAASRALAWTADRAARAVIDVSGDVEVTGDGVLALGIRRLVSQTNVHRLRVSTASALPVRPSAVILTTREPDALVSATRRVADLGVLVLVSEIAEPFGIDLYPDVHSRGLALVGVPGPLACAKDSEPHPLETVYRNLLVPGHYGRQVVASGCWFRFSGELST